MDESRYGVCSHATHDDLYRQLAAAGVRWHRADFDWPAIEPEQGRFEWGNTDRIVALAGELGLSMVAVLAYTPPWASGSSDKAKPPMDPGLYVEFVRRAVERYGSAVAAWSVWNEPNLKQFWSGGDRQFNEDIWLPGLRAVKELGGVTAGPDLTGLRSLRTWMPMLLRSSVGLLDVVAHHQYDGGDTVRGRLRELDEVRRFLVSIGFDHLPFWCTETGWDRLSRPAQALALRGMMEGMHQRPWWGKTFWYDSNGPGWGLFYEDVNVGGDISPGGPTPSFEAYAQVIGGVA